jgi:hypothetical protein
MCASQTRWVCSTIVSASDRIRSGPSSSGTRIRTPPASLLARAHRDKRDAEEALAARYAEVLRQDPRVTGVRVDHWAAESPPILRVTIDDPELREVSPHLIEEALNRNRPAQSRLHIGFRDGVLSFGEDQYAPDQALAAFDTAVANAKARASDLEAARQEAEATQQRLLQEARAAFADLPVPASEHS